MKKIKVGSDFSGVGAFDQALKRLKINYQTIYACDWDKYARETFIHNYGEPKYYPKDVYEREIPSESLDIYMTSPPCQSFSLAGKRLGKDDKRGVLFFNSHEFIQVNKPRYFIFENVKGLLSDDNGKTFSEWVGMLGGKSVNGNPILFPYENSVPYHLYWKVLNAKEHGIPQNRERVFLIGIRDDQDNNFRFPVEEHLTKRLKDVLEESVDDKYFLSEKMINYISKDRKGNDNLITDRAVANTITCVIKNMQRSNQDNYILINKVGYINQDTQGSSVYCENGTSQTITAGTHGYSMGYIKIKSATSTGFEIATEGDSINFAVPNSETRRGRVGHGVAQTLDTGCQQGVMIGTWRTHKDGQGFREIEDGNCPTIPARAREDGSGQPVIMQLNNSKHSQQRIYSTSGISPTLSAGSNGGGQNPCKHLTNDYKIRRLTPRECFRLMDFPDSFTWPVSDSQAYKQAGNSIVVNVLAKIINKLNL